MEKSLFHKKRVLKIIFEIVHLGFVCMMINYVFDSTNWIWVSFWLSLALFFIECFVILLMKETLKRNSYYFWLEVLFPVHFFLGDKYLLMLYSPEECRLMLFYERLNMLEESNLKVKHEIEHLDKTKPHELYPDKRFYEDDIRFFEEKSYITPVEDICNHTTNLFRLNKTNIEHLNNERDQRLLDVLRKIKMSF